MQTVISELHVGVQTNSLNPFSYLMYLLLFQGRSVLSFDLEKGGSTLGISIVVMETKASGGHGIFIQKIQPDSVAYRYKRTRIQVQLRKT